MFPVVDTFTSPAAADNVGSDARTASTRRVSDGLSSRNVATPCRCGSARSSRDALVVVVVEVSGLSLVHAEISSAKHVYSTARLMTSPPFVGTEGVHGLVHSAAHGAAVNPAVTREVVA